LDEKEVHYRNRSKPDKVDYDIIINDKFDMKEFEKKMCTSLNLDNIVVFDKEEKIVKVTLVELFEMWGEARLALNAKRRHAQLVDIDRRSHMATCKSNFIKAVRSKQIDVTSEERNIISIIKMNAIAQQDVDIKMLLDMSVRTLTEEKRRELELSIKKMARERELLCKKTDKDIWIEDLTKLNL
jgi:hypothetical protein